MGWADSSNRCSKGRPLSLLLSLLVNGALLSIFFGMEFDHAQELPPALVISDLVVEAPPEVKPPEVPPTTEIPPAPLKPPPRPKQAGTHPLKSAARPATEVVAPALLNEPTHDTDSHPPQPEPVAQSRTERTASPSAINLYADQVWTHANTHRPPGSRFGGKVTLRLILTPDGRIADLSIIASTASAGLGQRIMNALYAAPSFPIAPSDATEQQRTFVIEFDQP